MLLKKIFDGRISDNTPLGGIDLSGFTQYSVLLRLDHSQNNTRHFNFTTYNNNIQVSNDIFLTTLGWHTHNAIYKIFHPLVSFVMYTPNSADVKLWVYATCCNPTEMLKNPKTFILKKVEFTKLGVIKTVTRKR